MASAYRREGCIRREMEAAWQPPSPKTGLPRYDPENDPFCPLAVARKFNHMQREATVHGTQSLIDTRSASGKTNATTSRRRSRPQSSGGRMATPHNHSGRGVITSGSGRSPALLAPPFLAGATLQLQDGGFTAVRRPPLSTKGLPSGTQVNAGLARMVKAARWLVAPPAAAPKASIGKVRMSGVEQATRSNWEGGPAELGADANKEEFAARVARRDDILQNLWLKMHSGEGGFTRVQGEVAHLLNLYRSATLEILEDMMRHSQLEKIADTYTKKKGDGMRSYREAVTQDADFADGIPEAIAWLGFSTRRNPLFLPPKTTTTTTTDKPSSTIHNNIGLTGGADEEARLRDAQYFVLDQHSNGGDPNAANKILKPASSGRGYDARIDGEGLPNEGSTVLRPDRRSGGNTHKRALRDRVRSINGQLAGAQETIRGLEGSLRSLEGERDRGKQRAARVREAAAEAGRQKLAQRMYRLRGAAAFLEEGVEVLGTEIAAVRVRLFAERLDVSRKRMLKDALISEVAVKSKARRRKTCKKKEKTVDVVSIDRSAVNGDFKLPATQDEGVHAEGILQRRDSSAAAIQARIRGIRARAEALQVKADKTNAAVRIEAAARGRFVRKKVAAERFSMLDAQVEAVPVVAVAAAAPHDRAEEGGNELETSTMPRPASEKAAGLGYQGDASSKLGCTPKKHRSTAVESMGEAAVAVEIEALENLGAAGVRGLFDSLGLGACIDDLHRQPGHTVNRSLRARRDEGDAHESVGIDGTDLARIVRSSDPNTELLAVGVGARLHRVKILATLGLGRAHSATAAISGASPPAERTPPEVTAAASVPDRVIPAAPAAAIAALGMVWRLRQDQEVISDALCSAMGRRSSAISLPTATPGRLGHDEACEKENITATTNGCLSRPITTADNNGDRAGELPLTLKQTRSLNEADEFKHEGDDQALTTVLKRDDERRAAVDGRKMISVPLRLIPELEQAVYAQAGIFAQVQEVLDFYAEIGSSAKETCDSGVEVGKGRPVAAAGIVINARKTLES